MSDEQMCLQDGGDGMICIKYLRRGMDFHGGGHIFVAADQSPNVREVMAGGHYDAVALISGLPADWHEPQDCHQECPQWTGPWTLPTCGKTPTVNV